VKKVFRIIGILFASILGLILVTGVVLYIIGNARLNKKYDFPPSNLTIPTDEESISIGKHRAESLCAGCHGDDLSGVSNWFDEAPIGKIDSANLTFGPGGVGREFTSDEDYVRAIRHGIDPNGKPTLMFAVPATSHLSDEELADIIAYLKTIPPVDHNTNGHQITPIGKIMLAAGQLGNLPVEDAIHEVHVDNVPSGVTVEYGKYLVDINDCRTCHGADLAGARIPDPTITKVTPDLTPGGELGMWTEEEFVNTLRTGITPHGHELDPEFMPREIFEGMTENELKAMWMYLQSLPELGQYSP
jgi:mono/diheme cytochrome c family protein